MSKYDKLQLSISRWHVHLCTVYPNDGWAKSVDRCSISRGEIRFSRSKSLVELFIYILSIQIIFGFTQFVTVCEKHQLPAFWLSHIMNYTTIFIIGSNLSPFWDKEHGHATFMPEQWASESLCFALRPLSFGYNQSIGNPNFLNQSKMRSVVWFKFCWWIDPLITKLIVKGLINTTIFFFNYYKKSTDISGLRTYHCDSKVWF